MGSRNGNDGRVVLLSDYRPDDRPVAAELAHLRRVWSDLRRDGALPARAALAPRAIGPALSSTFLLGRIAPGHARLRVAGTRLAALMGMDLHGMPLAALFDPAARPPLAALLEEVFDTPCGALLSLSAPSGIGRPALGAEMLILPMADRHGVPRYALGGLVWSGRAVGRTPRRMGMTGTRRLPLHAPRPPAPQPCADMARAATDPRSRPPLHLVRPGRPGA